MQIFEGHLDGNGHSYGLVVSRFNSSITEQLLQGALEALTSHGVEENKISIAWVPGAFEISLIAKKWAASKKFDGIICLGAVIRGETAHFDLIAGEAASGISTTSLETGVPVIFSVITADTVEQANARSDSQGVNIGYNGAMAAIETVNLLKKL